MNNEFENKIKELTDKLPDFVKRVPGIIKDEGLQFIADNFEHEGFEEKAGSYRPWQRKKMKGAQKKILIGENRGGSLRRSWKQETTADDKRVAFKSSLPYAEIHNEGGRTRAHVIKAKEKKALKTPYGLFRKVNHPGSIMPQRQMIGESEALDKRIGAKLDRIMNNLFK